MEEECECNARGLKNRRAGRVVKFLVVVADRIQKKREKKARVAIAVALNLPDVPELLNRTVKNLCHQSCRSGSDR